MWKHARIAMVVTATVMALGAAPAAAAVGAHAHATGAPADVMTRHTSKGVTGTWSGTWRRTSAPPTTGTMTVTLTQKGNKLSGDESVVGSACLTSHKITGTLNGKSITFTISQPGIHASYSGKVSGKTMSGSLQVTCGTATGKGDFKLKEK